MDAVEASLQIFFNSKKYSVKYNGFGKQKQNLESDNIGDLPERLSSESSEKCPSNYYWSCSIVVFLQNSHYHTS